jgi:hypothetical protein
MPGSVCLNGSVCRAFGFLGTGTFYLEGDGRGISVPDGACNQKLNSLDREQSQQWTRLTDRSFLFLLKSHRRKFIDKKKSGGSRVVTQTRGRTDEPPKLSTPKKFHIVQHPVSHLRRVLFNHPIRSNFFYFELGTDQLVIFIVDLPRSFGSASVPIVNPSRLIQQNVTNKHSLNKYY